MTQPIIQVENFGKRYRLSHQTRGVGEYRSLGESVTRLGRNLVRKLRHPLAGANETVEDFWALKGVNFEIAAGDRVGIIGRNGAGKSTLLKLLCRITEPSAGKAVLRGRVASLLEVGTGFHPELSGRENIYLNGSILGMKHAEIKRKFDEIVDFSGVEKFLDTPVKRYSSGMYVRLAFAVAAHLEPEILLIDEVLAVGDAEFQKKCLGKMEDISRNSGRTILFVSHNMAAVKNLCNRGILLDQGRIAINGPTETAIAAYQQNCSGELNLPTDFSTMPRFRPESLSRQLEFTAMEFCNFEGKTITPETGSDLTIRLHLKSRQPEQKNCRLSIAVESMDKRLLLLSSEMTRTDAVNLVGDPVVECRIPKLPLPGSLYWLTLFAESNGVVADWVKNVPMQVEDGDYYQTGKLLPPDHEPLCLVNHSWHAVPEGK